MTRRGLLGLLFGIPVAAVVPAAAETNSFHFYGVGGEASFRASRAAISRHMRKIGVMR